MVMNRDFKIIIIIIIKFLDIIIKKDKECNNKYNINDQENKYI